MYSRAVRVLRALFRLEGWRAQGTPAPAPAVYVVHHQNMAGPIRAVAHLPLEGHIWALEVFCNAKTCFAQYYGYTFTKRFGMPKPLAFVCAKLVSGAVSGIVRGCGAIPVYRGRREIVETMRLSQQVLEKGENIILCPDCGLFQQRRRNWRSVRGLPSFGKGLSPRHGQAPCLCAGGPVCAHKARAHGRAHPLCERRALCAAEGAGGAAPAPGHHRAVHAARISAARKAKQLKTGKFCVIIDMSYQ